MAGGGEHCTMFVGLYILLVDVNDALKEAWLIYCTITRFAPSYLRPDLIKRIRECRRSSCIFNHDSLPMHIYHSALAGLNTSSSNVLPITQCSGKVREERQRFGMPVSDQFNSGGNRLSVASHKSNLIAAVMDGCQYWKPRRMCLATLKWTQ